MSLNKPISSEDSSAPLSPTKPPVWKPALEPPFKGSSAQRLPTNPPVWRAAVGTQYRRGRQESVQEAARIDAQGGSQPPERAEIDRTQDAERQAVQWTERC